jgi:tetratricopeptide (TPR) repeat protein
MFDMPGFDSLDEQAKFEQLQSQAASTPNDPSLQLRLANAYRQGGAQHLAKRQIKSYLQQNPNSAEGYLALALLQTEGKRQVSSAAKDNALKALNLGLSNPRSVVSASRVAGEYFLNVGKYAPPRKNSIRAF